MGYFSTVKKLFVFVLLLVFLSGCERSNKYNPEDRQVVDSSDVTEPSSSAGSEVDPAQNVDKEANPQTDGESNPDSSEAKETNVEELPKLQVVLAPASTSGKSSEQIELSSFEEGTSFEVSIDGGEFVKVTMPFTTPELADGVHTLEVRSTDAAGNATYLPVIFNWTVDTKAPQVTIKQSPQQFTPQNSANFEFDVNETNAIIEVDIDGNGFHQVDQSVSINDLAEGVHTITVRVTDSIGNTSELKTFKWIVDHTAPIVYVKSSVNKLTVANDVQFEIVSSEDNVIYKASLDDLAFPVVTNPFNVEVIYTLCRR